ncbi:MAG: glutathione peroxidase [Telmatospirillum sp.]|nr:glutathione peroxidase [Telmatospirillum sp.]
MGGLDDIEIRTIDGDWITFGHWAGAVRLVVNVASKCGFTPQYRGLEALYRTFHDQGFVILGFPCDQFGHQEPGTDAEIRTFCQTTYDVSFPMFSKIDVNGPDTHPLYRRLKEAAPGLLGTGAIKWNFTKFLIDRDGTVLRRFAPTDSPEAIAPEIEALMAR